MEIQKTPSPAPTVRIGPEHLPFSLDIVCDYLAGFSRPDKGGAYGSLRIRRTVDASGGVTLAISQATGPLRIGDRIAHTTARIVCAPDRLATPSNRCGG